MFTLCLYLCLCAFYGLQSTIPYGIYSPGRLDPGPDLDLDSDPGKGKGASTVI